jgi:hypothetical protein
MLCIITNTSNRAVDLAVLSQLVTLRRGYSQLSIFGQILRYTLKCATIQSFWIHSSILYQPFPANSLQKTVNKKASELEN